jgi:hypothetical protein
MLRRAALVRTDVSEELSASFISVTSINELGTTLAIYSNRRKLWRNTWYFFAACVGYYIRLTFLVHRFLSPWWRRRYVPPKRQFLQEPHGVTSQKMAFFIIALTYELWEMRAQTFGSSLLCLTNGFHCRTGDIQPFTYSTRCSFVYPRLTNTGTDCLDSNELA